MASSTPTQNLSFLHWLTTQTHRQDPVGQFARLAVRDPFLPAAKTLRVVLLRFEGSPDKQTLAKRAHREYRRWRASLKATR